MRIPSEFNGIFGFKGTSDRYTSLGANSLYEDNFNPLTAPLGRIRAVVGAMGTSIDDVVLGTKLLLHPEANKFDIFAPPMPFDEAIFERARSG